MIALIALMAGLILAQRFTVLVLLPATLAALALGFGDPVAAAEAAIGLQVGYLAGYGFRFIEGRPRRPSSTQESP